MKRICFSGGGTLGSVSPLLAVHVELLQRHPMLESLFIGTLTGPEREIIEAENIPFHGIRSGKLRRYRDLQNLVDPFRVMGGVLDAYRLLKTFQPDVMFSAGGFVSVPVAIACRMRSIPVVIHQQDVIPGLANRLMSPLAQKITVTFEQSQHQFPLHKTVWCGNPVRRELEEGSVVHAQELFSLEPNLPTVLVLGGGTGARSLNRIVVSALPELLTFCQILHSAGKGKNVFQDTELQKLHQPDSVLTEHPQHNPYLRYHVVERLSSDEMRHAYAVADIVVTRAGMSTLSELAFLGKPTIVVPMPGSHQEANARLFEEQDAVVSLPHAALTKELLTSTIRELWSSPTKRARLEATIQNLNRKDAAVHIAKVLETLCA